MNWIIYLILIMLGIIIYRWRADKDAKAIVISIIAFSVSVVTLHIEHLRSFNLIIEEGANVTIAKHGDKYILGVPFILFNSGAKTGVVKSFVFYVTQNKKQIKPNATLVFEIPDFIKIRKSLNLLRPICLQRRAYKSLNVGRQLNTLSPGTYECEIIVILANGEKIRKSFSFPLVEKRVEDIESGIILHTPTTEILKVDKK
jgi:hypothetical protein